MRAEKCPPLGKGTGGTPTNRKEKRMPLHLTPDTVDAAIARIEEQLESHGGSAMWRYMLSMQTDPIMHLHLVTAYLPLGVTHPDATGSGIQSITVSNADRLTALVILGDKIAEAVSFRVAS